MRYALTALAALLLALVLAGCGGEKTDAPPRLRMGYFPNVTHAQALVGVHRGDFARAFEGHADFSSMTFNAGPSVIEAMFGGQLDIAYIGPSPTINGFIRSGGREVRVIAGAVDNGILIVGNTKRGITTLAQLKGARIATPQLANTQDVSARHYVIKELKSTLKDNGGETEIIPIANPDIEILFEKDQIDAAWIPEPWASRLIDRGLVTRIAAEHELWESGYFTLTNVIVRADFLQKHPDLVRRFLEVHVALTREFEADRHALAPILNDQMEALTKKRLPDAVLRGALDNVEFREEPDRPSFETFHAWARDLGFLPAGDLDLDKLIRPELLKEVLATP